MIEDTVLSTFLTFPNPTPPVIRYSLRRCAEKNVLTLFKNIPKDIVLRDWSTIPEYPKLKWNAARSTLLTPLLDRGRGGKPAWQWQAGWQAGHSGD